MRNRLVRVAIVAGLAIGMSAAVVAPGGAATPVQKCSKLSGSATFSPGLGPLPANNTVSAKGTLSGCTPNKATGGAGVLTATIKVPGGSCVKLATGNQKLTGTGSAKWKNHKTSKYSLNFTTGTGKNITVATVTGTVTSGLFAGKKVSGQISFTVKPGQDCTVAHPVKNITFKQTKPFVTS
jgi:hypothetical protein